MASIIRSPSRVASGPSSDTPPAARSASAAAPQAVAKRKERWHASCESLWPMPRLSRLSLALLTLAATLCTGRAQQSILRPFYSVGSAESSVVGGFRLPADRDDLPVRRALPVEPSEVIPRAVPVSFPRSVELPGGPT